jgi:choline kinase
MKAIILSAGQGRRLLPLTRAVPKCLIRVQGERSILEHQLRALAECGVERATVMTGFASERVEEALARMQVDGLAVRTQYNPVYATTDNLITAWLGRDQMDEDFVLLNGDTLFESEVLRRLLAAEPAPISIAVDRKPYYDDDDMKVAFAARGVGACAPSARS